MRKSRRTWNGKNEETNAQKREVSTICVYTRDLRDYWRIYIYMYPLPPASLCLPSQTLFPISRVNLSPESFFFYFLLSVFDSSHRVSTSRLPLYHPAIISHTCHSLSLSSPPQSTRPTNPPLPTRITSPRLLRCTHHTRPSIKYTFCRRAGRCGGRLFIFPVTVIFQTRTARWINVPGCFWRAWKIRCRLRRHFSRSLRGKDDKDLDGELIFFIVVWRYVVVARVLYPIVLFNERAIYFPIIYNGIFYARALRQPTINSVPFLFRPDEKNQIGFIKKHLWKMSLFVTIWEFRFSSSNIENRIMPLRHAQFIKASDCVRPLRSTAFEKR